MIWDLYDLDLGGIEPIEVSKESEKQNAPRAPYHPGRDEIVATTRPYLAKPLWPTFDKIVTENSSLCDILQRVADEELLSAHDKVPFERDLRKLYQMEK